MMEMMKKIIMELIMIKMESTKTTTTPILYRQKLQLSSPPPPLPPLTTTNTTTPTPPRFNSPNLFLIMEKTIGTLFSLHFNITLSTLSSKPPAEHPLSILVAIITIFICFGERGGEGDVVVGGYDRGVVDNDMVVLGKLMGLVRRGAGEKKDW